MRDKGLSAYLKEALEKALKTASGAQQQRLKWMAENLPEDSLRLMLKNAGAIPGASSSASYSIAFTVCVNAATIGAKGGSKPKNDLSAHYHLSDPERQKLKANALREFDKELLRSPRHAARTIAERLHIPVRTIRRWAKSR